MVIGFDECRFKDSTSICYCCYVTKNNWRKFIAKAFPNKRIEKVQFIKNDYCFVWIENHHPCFGIEFNRLYVFGDNGNVFCNYRDLAEFKEHCKFIE